ncbi:MAG: DUF975 family protein [Oscillospiraceae bacterium]|nr:DUF975 family protein [Oscillospiraceae bacterium]
MIRVESKREAREILKGRWGKAVSIVIVHTVFTYLISLISTVIPIVGPTISGTISAVISAVLTYNLVVTFMRFKRGEDVNAFDIITKIPENFVAAWKVMWGIFLKMWGYVIALMALLFIFIFSISMLIVFQTMEAEFGAVNSVFTGTIAIFTGVIAIALLIISIFAMIRGLYYAFTWEILFDTRNEISGKKAAEKSEKLMQGRRWELFIFRLSFIGWVLLAMTPMIIGIILMRTWMMPMSNLWTVQSMSMPIFYNFIINMLILLGTMWVTSYVRVAETGFYERLLAENKELMEVKEEEKVVPAKGWSVASLVLGICGFMMMMVPVIPIICGILAIIFARVSKRKAGESGLGIAGLVIGIVVTVIASMILAVLAIGVGITAISYFG